MDISSITMKAVIGYVVAVIGLVILTFGAGGFEIPGVSLLDKTIVNTIAMIFVAVGVMIVIIGGGGKGSSGGGGGFFSNLFGGKDMYPGKRKSKRKGKIMDLPIYEGDDIVAYRRD